MHELNSATCIHLRFESPQVAASGPFKIINLHAPCKGKHDEPTLPVGTPTNQINQRFIHLGQQLASIFPSYSQVPTCCLRRPAKLWPCVNVDTKDPYHARPVKILGVMKCLGSPFTQFQSKAREDLFSSWDRQGSGFRVFPFLFGGEFLGAPAAVLGCEHQAVCHRTQDLDFEAPRMGRGQARRRDGFHEPLNRIYSHFLHSCRHKAIDSLESLKERIK